ncbi:MAG TPA: isopentenyl phosphate kinase [Methanomassiliicoccales archaeon]
MILVKLGGSVITDKTTYRTFREGTVRRLAREMMATDEERIVVHGAGSYGHIYAKEYALQSGLHERRQVEGVAKVMHDVRELDNLVVGAFNDEGMWSAAIPPGSSAIMKNGTLSKLDLWPFERFLKIGMTPVTFGDVALDDDKGVSICSGDQLMMRLAERFRPRKVIFCADVDGLYTADPNCDPNATLIEKVDRDTLATIPRTERCIDVTGSIYAKIEYMLQIARNAGKCEIINGNAEGRLADVMADRRAVSSRIIGED